MKKLLLILLVVIGIQTQAQIMPCDSVGFTADTSYSVYVQFRGVANVPGTILSWDWVFIEIWSGTIWQTSTSQTPLLFTGGLSPGIVPDTFYTCLTVIWCDTINNLCYTCITCDSLFYDMSSNNAGWILTSTLPQPNPLGIKEIDINTKGLDNKMYDMLGRELNNYNSIPIGTMYIQNRKKYIKSK